MPVSPRLVCFASIGRAWPGGRCRQRPRDAAVDVGSLVRRLPDVYSVPRRRRGGEHWPPYRHLRERRFCDAWSANRDTGLSLRPRRRDHRLDLPARRRVEGGVRHVAAADTRVRGFGRLPRTPDTTSSSTAGRAPKVCGASCLRAGSNGPTAAPDDPWGLDTVYGLVRWKNGLFRGQGPAAGCRGVPGDNGLPHGGP